MLSGDTPSGYGGAQAGQPSCATPSGAVREHQPRLLGPLRSAEQVAERTVAAELTQPRTFRPRLHAFGDDANTVRMSELDDRRNDRVVLQVRAHAANERPVQLHRLDRQLAKRPQGGVPR